MQATLDYRRLIVRKLALRKNSCNLHGALLIRLAEGVCVQCRADMEKGRPSSTHYVESLERVSRRIHTVTRRVVSIRKS